MDVEELLLGNWRNTRNGETIFNECHSQPRRYRQGSFEQRFAISGFNFNDRLECGTMKYGVRVAGLCGPPHTRHSPPSWSLFGTGPMFDPILFTIGRVVAAFSDNSMAKPSALHLPASVRLFLDTFCVLFAYFVLRTRRIPPEPFPACVSSTTGMSMPLMVTSATRYVWYFWREERRKAGETLLSVASSTCTGLSMISCLHRSASGASEASGVECIHMCT